ncbi:MAG: hypothetical protein EA398_17865 [Deltaproteobacteria bacterium]|nr:MAG: hypothetical protein EA398_17865 [Deltaproteobacteria bacterium]
MRELGFLVADSNMAHSLHGLFGRDGWHLSVGCAAVEVGREDVHTAAGQCDPGLFVRAGELLRPFSARYRRMVVMVDAEWEGSPGAEAIRLRLRKHLEAAGWKEGTGLGLVLDPEVDAWLWTRTDHTARALGWSDWSTLEPALVEGGLWSAEQPKPPRPKEAAEWALRKSRKPRSSMIYEQVAGAVSLQRCGDPALAALRDALRRWFPRP